MIFDHIKHLDKYRCLHPDVDNIIEYFTENNLEKMSPGRYGIAGTGSFVLIQQYETKSPGEVQWESHNRYIDLQYVISGAEQMAYMPTSQLKPSTAYDEDKDVIFYGEPDFSAAFEVNPGFFAIFFPTDAHKPSCRIDGAKEVKKIIVKLPVITE